MTTTPHHSTVQISSIVLQLRHDLSVSVREFGGQPVYVIEDEINSRFFRIGLAEYTFLSVLDGHTNFADALGQTASVMKEDALTETEAAAFCSWLIENRLAATPQSETSARLFEAHQQARQRKCKGRLNPIFVRIPLLNPDSFLSLAAMLFGWILSGVMLPVWILMVSAGVLAVAMNWSEAVSGSAMIIAENNWIWLLGTWLLLKLAHETAHGIACRRFGGNVREAGVLLLLLVPLPYVDVTSAWRFESKWQRIIVSAAGMYAELFVAAMAAVVWSQTQPGLLHQHAFNVMLSGSLVTVAFNANPLMRFDGYYILCDLLELPNLAAHGQQSLMRIGRRAFFGLPAPTRNRPEGRAGTILVYGILAFVWRILVCLGLVLAADALYFGAGVVLAAMAVTLWIVIPGARLLKFIMIGSRTEQPRRLQFAAVTGSLLLLGYVVWAYVPWYSRFETPAVVDYATLMDIRTGVSGFVESVEVECGDHVAEGDLLVTLQNPELHARRTELVKHLEEAQRRARQYFDEEQIAAWQVEQQNEESLSQQLVELDEQCNDLRIKSPMSGVILDRAPSELLGTYLKRGDMLLRIGDDRHKQVSALIAPQSADAFTDRVGREVTVHINGTGLQHTSARLLPPSPRASTAITHPAFSAATGGPLPVVAVEVTGAAAPQIRFTEPQLRAELQVDPEALDGMWPGRLGVVSFRTLNGTVGEVVAKRCRRWFETRQTALRAWSY